MAIDGKGKPPQRNPNEIKYMMNVTMKLSSVLFFLLTTTISYIQSANAFATYSSRDYYLFQHRHDSKKATSALQGSSSNSNSNSYDDSSSPIPDVLCIGETLWDSLPSGIYLGGAPSNVAVHLAYLFNNSPPSSSSSSSSDKKASVAVATCLGNDQLGKEAQRRLALNGVRTDYVQVHSAWETGMATAILDSNGDATYEFNTPAAWDGLCFDSNLKRLIQHQEQQKDEDRDDNILFVMGTIAGRLDNEHGATSLSTLMSVRNTAPEGTVVVDINLRSPWYKDETVLELIRGSAKEKKKLALLKVNEEELATLEQWCGNMDTNADDLFGDALRTRMEQVAQSLNTLRICVTRGDKGAALWCQNGNDVSFNECLGYSLPEKKNDSDTVGAGDSFLASLINSLFIQTEPPEKALERACALGGYVAGCRGATPAHCDAPDSLRNVFSI